tara:strand:+ start:2988 stop:3398 length:411 start_codon:yes stop_codon:yes gene_type:complete
MKDYFLIYINKVGANYKGNILYEFIFSDTIEHIDGENWDTYPASGRPESPHSKFIKKVGVLETDVVFELIQNSDTLAVWDAIDGVIAMAYENINDYDTYPETRLHFHFGDKIKEIEEKLYEKDLILNYIKQIADDK